MGNTSNRRRGNKAFSHRLCLAAVLSTIACAIPALAQPAPSTAPADAPADSGAAELATLSLEELMNVQISTVSRVDERIDEAPGSVHLFSRETIQQRGYRSLGELLQVVPGFTVFHRDLDFVAGVRGLNANDNEKITLLVNGQNVNGVNEPAFLNGPINLDNVERVEVVVGPSSLFQQGDTLAATVNVITRDVEGVTAIVGTGNDLRYSTTFMAGHHFAKDQFLSLSLTTEEIKGFDAWSPDFRPNLAGREVTGALDQPNFFGVLRGQYGELSGQFVAYRTMLPELLIDSGDPRNDGHLVDQVYAAQLRIDHHFSNDLRAIVTGDVAYKQQYRRNDGEAFNTEQQTISQVVYRTDWGLQYSGINNHFFQLGAQATYEDNFDSWYSLDSADQTVDRDTLIGDDAFAVGFYVDDTFRLTPQWKFVAGARIDHSTRLDGGRWYPGWRTAVIYEPNQNWISKLVYNRAVRMPSNLAAQNRAWGQGRAGAPGWATLAPNAEDPEILTTVSWENIVYVHKVRLSATLYHQQLNDFISWFGPHTNVGDFEGNGVELAAQAPLGDSINLWANASYNDSQLEPFTQYSNPVGGALEEHHVLTNDDGRIIGAPEWTANAGLDFHITRNLSISPSVRYITEQAAFDFTSGSDIVIRNRVYVDLGVLWNNAFGKENMALRFSATNLLDNRDPVGGQWIRDTYHPRGIAGAVSLEYKF
jgi:outer membrane receptor protein involved in Fe transport